MGWFTKSKGTGEPAPKLHKGPLVEMQVYPVTGRFDAREEAADGASRRVVWCTFKSKKVTSGEHAGGTTANVVAVNTGKVLGYFDPGELAARPDVIRLLGKASHATVYLELDEVRGKDAYRATVRFGKHDYMPRPFWK